MSARTAEDPRQRGCALVTGASRGIGAAIALGLAEDGWRCGINYRRDEAGAADVTARITDAGGRALPLASDVSAPDEVDAAFARLEATWGPVLCLVNCAGVRADALGALMTGEQWSHVIRTNLDGAFATCRRAVGPMLRARWGRVVNIASVAGVRGSPGQVNYSAAKAGLIGLTRSLAVETASRGITVNAVAPGIVETELTADVSPELVEMVPARRSGLPEEVAHCVRFLVSGGAGYVTGATLPVDGGLSA